MKTHGMDPEADEYNGPEDYGMTEKFLRDENIYNLDFIVQAKKIIKNIVKRSKL